MNKTHILKSLHLSRKNTLQKVAQSAADIYTAHKTARATRYIYGATIVSCQWIATAVIQNNTMQKYINELETAKKNVQTLLDEPNALVDMHGIEYWAGRVERLRELIRNSL